jgi:dGTPase
MNLDKIKANMNRDSELCSVACKNAEAIRFKEELNDIRPPYLRDADRIIYSLSYTRYIDKTQVFSNTGNDNISRRMTHVQMVSKIARTIGRALKLNEDLIEAAALGHDLGHVPFGHAGEHILNDISLKHNQGFFNHNVESVRELMFLENNGQGCNLTVQVLDAILCHNGEIEFEKYVPVKKSKEQFLKEYNNCYVDEKAVSKLIPMTLEGCVVRVSDIIAYIGKDIEDAIRLGKLTAKDLPDYLVNDIGIYNRDIVNAFVNDIIDNSFEKPYICMSHKMFTILKKLKQFNYDNIYFKANSNEQLKNWQNMFESVFDNCLLAIKNNDLNANIFKVYLNQMNNNYLKNTSDERKVIDYLAGMTDDYLIKQYELLD